MAGRRGILAFSNPRRNRGAFFECFNSKRDFWQTSTIDCRDVEGTDKTVYDQIIAEYGEDSYQARVEVYGEFPADDEDQFISPTVVTAAQQRPKYDDPTAPTVIGVDPARSGADATVIVVRRGRDIVNIHRYRGEDTMTTVGRVIDAIDQYSPVLTVIDEGGLGYGVLDRLTEQKYKVRGVNMAWKAKNPIMYVNKRAEIWGLMKTWLDHASIPKDNLLKSDLTGVTTKPTSSGAIQLEGKKEMRARGLASPDSADALALTFAFPVAHREHIDKAPRKVYNHREITTGWMAS